MNQIAYLKKSFDEFNASTRKLQTAYERLERQFAAIDRQLAEKNRELEAVVAENREIRNHLENILQSLTDGVIVTDPAGEVKTVNRVAEHLLGVSLQSIPGGLEFLVGGPMEETAPSPHGKIARHGRILEIHRSALRAPGGESIGQVLVLRDVTRMEMLEEMAKRREKLVAMGEMAANFAHEIRNPLGSIELFASLLLKTLGEPKERNQAAQIITAVKNLDNKISNLLLFAHTPVPVMRRVSAGALLKEILLFVKQLIENNIALTVHHCPGDPLVDGDPEMIKQVFLNIMLNAIQAMPEGGRLDVTTNLFDDHRDVGKGTYFEVKFSDSGVGISAADRRRVFDPFFSTKERASGLGLTIVHNILDLHGGSIRIEGGRNGGTVIRVWLPVCHVDSTREEDHANDSRRR